MTITKISSIIKILIKLRRTHLCRSMIGLVQNDRLQERLKQLLSKFPIPIDLIYWNSGQALEYFFDMNLDLGKISPRDIKRFPNELRTILRTPPKNNGIGIILTHNEGGGEVKSPLTPWMVIHRMCHAIGMKNPSRIVEDITEKLFDAYKVEIFDNQGELVQIGHVAKDFTVHWIRHICTFKAARDNNVFAIGSNFGEGFVDLMVQYMINGAVKLQLPPEVITFPRSYDEGTVRCTCIDQNQVNYTLAWFENAINSEFNKRLTDSQGYYFAC